jgi:pimeloyl-ACP methyl ester carboxylesterase
VILAVLAAAAALAAPAQAPPFELTKCIAGGVLAGCGTLRVPENRAKPDGRTIGLYVVLVPALHKAEPDAVTYLAGGPGEAATDETGAVVSMLAAVHENHVIFFVDQRGTGRSRPPRRADPTQYGTRAAMDDLDAVRAALGYAQLDLYGASYGATAAQVYLKRHRHSVRTIVLDGVTFIDRTLYASFARNAQRALARVAARCEADAACTRVFPHWTQTLARLIRTWNARPVHPSRGTTMTGDDLAGVVQTMLLSADSAASIPLVVARAAAGDFGPLGLQTRPGVRERRMMFWSIWCNEPWVGLGATGPWHTLFDGYTARTIAEFRYACRSVPGRTEPPAAWTLPARSQVPLLVLAGGSDPQDPVGNVSGLRARFPNARSIVVPGYGHVVGQFGCLGGLVSDFIDRASAAGLHTQCVRAIVPPRFALR